MRFVFILEDDPRFEKSLVDSIFSIDPKIQVRLFKTLTEFSDWLKVMMGTGVSALESAGVEPIGYKFEPLKKDEPHQLVLIISKSEFLGLDQLGLLRRTRDLFVQRKICTKEDPTAFVLTAFDNPNFPRSELQDKIISNILFKPFDPLILSQHLIFAIDGRHPPSKYTIGNQKTSTVIEMLKYVKVEEISEIGFVTNSEAAIPIGTVAKYYGKPFISDRHRSAFGVARSCIGHPTLQGQYQVCFTFFAADPTQISGIRRKCRAVTAGRNERDWSKINSMSDESIVMIGIDQEEDVQKGIYSQTANRFSNIKWITFKSYSDFYSEIDPESALKAAPAKSFSVGTDLVFIFDHVGSVFFGLEGRTKDTGTAFGLTEAQLKAKTNWLLNALPEESKDIYKKLFQGKINLLTDTVILPVQMDGKRFLVKVMELTQAEKKIKLRLGELSQTEQVHWLIKNSKIPKKVHGIFAHHRNFEEGAAAKWNLILDKMKIRAEGLRPKLFNLAKKDYTDAEERELATYVEDVFFKPLDPTYLMQKLKFSFPKLNDLLDKLQIRTLKDPDTFKVATPVKISEISEAGFKMDYHREIPIGSFREMVLWQPYEVGAPELLAAVNYAELVPGTKPTFKLHFIFFGVTDLYLKEIRLWIRENYVLGKEKG